MHQSSDVTRALASYVVSSRLENLPRPVQKEAVRSLLNWTGCAIGGLEHDASRHARAFVNSFSGPPQATILGTPHRADIFRAAWVNGISSHVFDFDDTHL